MRDADGPLEALLASTHLAVPDDLPALLAEHAAALGATGAVLYLCDLEQRWLVPVVSPKADIELAAEAIDATLGGRSFRSMEVLESSDENGDVLLWVPVVDGTERLGVVQYESVVPPTTSSTSRRSPAWWPSW